MNESKDNKDDAGDRPAAEDPVGSPDESPADSFNDSLAEAVRQGRRFSLADAVAREAGGSLKGASPVPAARQLVLAIEQILERDLPDPDGSLVRTVAAQLADNTPLLARHFSNPTGALGEYLDAVLAEPSTLADLVRQADARWGRDYAERPHFERPDQAPDPDDPYTVAGVGTLLRILRARLSR